MDEPNDYVRGYLDGVAVASDTIAAYFADQKKKDAATLADLNQAQQMMQTMLLHLLAPLQETVRRLRPPA